MSQICVIGAGLSGAVVAQELARSGLTCDVFEARAHVGGNCHTERDGPTGVMVHVYGPHIFHTNDERVWNYVRQFDEFVPYTNRVKAISNGKVFSLPINLLTINQYFGKAFSPQQARLFIYSLADQSITTPANFEEQALRLLGAELYRAFFRGYTIKQWGVDPRELPASILKRLPVRFSYDDNYFDSRFQGIPRHGYTRMIERLLDHRNIRVLVNSRLTRQDAKAYQHTFYSGPLDEWFGYAEGRLGYRTLEFQTERHEGDFQGNAVINYCDEEIAWTRICEHKHFASWENHKRTLIYREHSRACQEGDVPCYPIPLHEYRNALDSYARMVADEKAVTFVGRLATYRYLDMDTTIAEALLAAEAHQSRRSDRA